MPQAYSDPSREDDDYALPDLEIFQRTAEECALDDEDMVWEYLKEFPLANMNSRHRQLMIDAIIEREGIKGGWFYWYCFPGCLPDSAEIGPYDSYQKALEAAREGCGMTQRTTIKTLRILVDNLNDYTGHPREGTITSVEGYYVLDYAYGGFRLSQIISATGGERNITPRYGAAVTGDLIRAYMDGIRRGRSER